MKYNPQNKPLNKGKVVKKANYKKGSMVDDGNEALIDILKNGGQVEVLSQSHLDTGVEVAQINIYFYPPPDKGN